VDFCLCGIFATPGAELGKRLGEQQIPALLS